MSGHRSFRFSLSLCQCKLKTKGISIFKGKPRDSNRSRPPRANMWDSASRCIHSGDHHTRLKMGRRFVFLSLSHSLSLVLDQTFMLAHLLSCVCGLKKTGKPPSLPKSQPRTTSCRPNGWSAFRRASRSGGMWPSGIGTQTVEVVLVFCIFIRFS